MEFSKSFLIRIFAILISIILLCWGFYEIFKYLVLLGVVYFDISIFSFDSTNINLGFSLLVLGLIIYKFGRHYTGFFKSVTNILVGFAAFLISIVIMFYVLDSNSTKIADSIQPSIDMISALMVDDLIEQNLDIKYGEKVSVIVSENISHEKFYNHNLTNSQKNYLLNELNIEESDSKKADFLSKILISAINEQLASQKEVNPDTPISLNMVSEQISSNLGVDLSTIASMSEELLSFYFTINDDAYITILKSSDKVKELTIGQLSNEDAISIWNSLGLTDTISLDSKKKVINIILSYAIDQMNNLPIELNSIPLASISSLIPDEITKVLEYDVLNKNISKRANEIKNLRNDCFNNTISFDEICDAITLSDYDVFMTQFNNLTQTANINVPENINSFISEIGTTDKVESYISEKSKAIWKKLLFVTIILLIISHITYFLHFKLFKRQLIKVHIPYYISKLNLFNIIPSLVILIIIYLISRSTFILNKVIDSAPENSQYALSQITNIPLYIVFDSIIYNIIFYTILYTIISGLIYLILRFVLSKKVSNLE